MRKTFYFLPLILFLFNGSLNLHAQCTVYGFYLDAEGFSCDSDGEICFMTNVNLLSNFFDCATDYVVEISFPTDAFTVNELNDFTVANTNPTTTTLRLIPNINTGFADIVHCLAGELLIPNTSFFPGDRCSR